MQIAPFLCSFILSRVACLAVPYFSILSHERHVFRKKKRLLNIKNILWFSLHILSKTFLIQDYFGEILPQMNNVSLHIKYPLFLPDFNEPWIFQSDFRKILKYKISRKSVLWKPGCSMQTDTTALGVAFRNFAKTFVVLNFNTSPLSVRL